MEMHNVLFEDREFKGVSGPSFGISSSASVLTEDGNHVIDTKDDDNRTLFYQNLAYWNNEIDFNSVDNFDNGYFESIVTMGKDAVPYIISELEQHPSELVHALERIFPGVVEYQGYVPLRDACEAWLSILR